MKLSCKKVVSQDLFPRGKIVVKLLSLEETLSPTYDASRRFFVREGRYPKSEDLESFEESEKAPQWRFTFIICEKNENDEWVDNAEKTFSVYSTNSLNLYKGSPSKASKIISALTNKDFLALSQQSEIDSEELQGQCAEVNVLIAPRENGGEKNVFDGWTHFDPNLPF